MNKLIAFVGMPGSGKTEATTYLQEKGFVRIRFGDIVEDEVKKRNLQVNEKNERMIREELREKYGMEAMAKLNIPKIENALKKKNVVIDGLYSWEEYLLLKRRFPEMIIIAVYSSPKTRYKRLGSRPIRPLKVDECITRDYSQLEDLHTGGPIAMADYTIINEGTLAELKRNVDKILKSLR